MEYKIDIYFLNGKTLSIALEKDDMDRLIDCITRNKPYFDKTKKSSLCVSPYCFTHYNHYEYTEELKKRDEEKVKAMKAKVEADAKQQQLNKEEEKK